MNILTSLKLGQSTSLLRGYKAKAVVGSHNEVAFIPSLKNALYEQDIIVNNPNYNAEWSYPTITLCDNAEDLLSSMLQICLRPSALPSWQNSSLTKTTWPAGAILLAGLTSEERTSSLRDISAEIGLDLSIPNWSYALVCRSRQVGTATHHCYEQGLFGDPKPDCTLKPEALKALKGLEKPKEVPDASLEGARGYLTFFETFGSHFVSSVTAGDVLLQVFAYESAEYKKLVKIYSDRAQDLSGPTAPTFAYFTVPHSKSTGYGYTSAVSKLWLASDDPAMSKTLEDGLWNENEYACTNSIFAPYLRPDSVNVNTVFKMIVITSIELSSLEVFAEHVRKQIFYWIFKSCMYCRYHRGTGVVPYFVNHCPFDLEIIFKNSDSISGNGLVSNIATPSIDVFKERFELNSLQLESADTVRTFSVFTNALTVTESDAAKINIPGSKCVTLIGHIISVGASLPRTPTHLRLSEKAYASIENQILCWKFYGCLLITNSKCSKSLVIVNGLVFKVINGEIALTSDVRHSSVSSSTIIEKHAHY